MENSEIIEVFFDLGTENVDWEKRVPRVVTYSQIETASTSSVSSTKKNNITNAVNTNLKKQNSKEDEEKIFREIKNIKLYISNREKESYGYFNSEEEYAFIARLDILIKIIKENMTYYPEKDEVEDCFRRINIIKQRVLFLRGSHKSNKDNKTTKKTNQVPSERGLEIQSRLREFKNIVKAERLPQDEIQKYISELKKYKIELSTKGWKFTKIDNIPSKLTQIECYILKLSGKMKSSDSVENKEESDIVDANRKKQQEGKTARGIEIQNLLENLKHETKRKDLNPIEKENLKNTLLALKRELETESNKFSKFDNIPIKLNQVENYLSKIESTEKPVQKTVEQKENTSIEENNTTGKKEKMKTIWRFGL